MLYLLMPLKKCPTKKARRAAAPPIKRVSIDDLTGCFFMTSALTKPTIINAIAVRKHE